MAEISGHIPLLSVTGRLFIEGEGRVNPGERTDRASGPSCDGEERRPLSGACLV